MASEMVPFLDLLETIVDNRGKTCPTAKAGIPLIATNCISNDRLYPAYEKVRYVSKDTYDSWFRGHPRPDDMIFVCKGSPGRVCWVPDPIDFCIAQDMVGIRADKKKVYPKYLFSVLRSPMMQREIENMHVGTLIPHFKKGDFDKLMIPLVGDADQRFIGDLYFSFCEKIEQNRRMNETLEAMAQALFKSWFVDFDPVIDNILLKNMAKYPSPNLSQKERDATGSSPAGRSGDEGAIFDGIPKEFAEKAERRKQVSNARKTSASAATLAKAGFPDSFQSSELGPIPKGWDVSSIGNEYRVVMGQSPKGDTYNEAGEGVLFFQGRAEFGWRFPTPRLYTTDPKRMANAGDALMSVRAPVGDFNMALNDCCVGRGLCALRHRSGSSSFTYYQMKDFQKHLDKFNAEGTVFGSINQKDLKAQECLAPPKNTVAQFAELAEGMDSKILSNSNQILVLTKLRDTLLPKLLSGELKVPDAEKMVEKVA